MKNKPYYLFISFLYLTAIQLLFSGGLISHIGEKGLSLFEIQILSAFAVGCLLLGTLCYYLLSKKIQDFSSGWKQYRKEKLRGYCSLLIYINVLTYILAWIL